MYTREQFEQFKKELVELCRKHNMNLQNCDDGLLVVNPGFDEGQSTGFIMSEEEYQKFLRGE